MPVPSSKIPQIVNADRAAIVKDPGTLVYNTEMDRLEVVDNAEAFVPVNSGGDIPDNVILQQLWVNDADGQDTNDGGEYTPFKTYGAAITHAALTASPTNRFLIRIIGDQAATAPVIHPYVDLEFSAGTFTVTGGLGLHTAWDNTVNNEIVTIKGMKLSGFWVFSWIGVEGNTVRFLDCDHSLTTSGNFLSNGPDANNLMIINDTAMFPTGYSSNLFITQSNSYLDGAKIANEIRYDVLLNGYTLNSYLLNSVIPFGIILKKSLANTSTQNVYVRNTPMPTGSPVLEDDLSNVYIDTDSYLNDPTILLDGSYANIITQGVKGIRQLLWVNEKIGNDLNNGSINAPFKTYEAARLLAKSQITGYPDGVVINIVGNLNITGDMMISPYIDVHGMNTFNTLISVSGDLILDPDWGTTANPFTIIKNLYYSGGVNLVYSAFQGFSFIRFEHITFQNVGTFSATGAGTSTDCEYLIFDDCTSDFVGEAPAYSLENVNGFFFNSDVSGNLNFEVSSATSQARLILEAAQIDVGNINLVASSTGTITGSISASLSTGSTLTLDGTPITLEVDATSYQFSLVFANGASLSNINVPTKSDGMTANLTPTNYTPAGSSTDKATSVTGNLRGIDNALAGKANVIPYQEITSLTTVMSPNNEYTANNAAVVSLTLPINAAVGDTIRVNGKGAGGWRIDQQNAGHIIHVGAASTTLGPTGSLASATQFASVTLRCITTNNVWVAIAFAGTFTPA